LNDLFAPPPVTSLAALRRDETTCRRCELYRDATQVVPGKGTDGAALMLVGEQPGDREDLAGKPFVGPAGAVLDRHPAGRCLCHHAVKHFKYELRGKRRLHKRAVVDWAAPIPLSAVPSARRAGDRAWQTGRLTQGPAGLGGNYHPRFIARSSGRLNTQLTRTSGQILDIAGLLLHPFAGLSV
jgi:hypothetical protein